MTTYVALLRAINVGGRTVKMKKLRDLFVELGCAEVRSYIASGNIIFESTSRGRARLEERIEEQLAERLGFTVATFLRTPEELGAIAREELFAGEGVGSAGAGLYVGFLKAPILSSARDSLAELSNEVDEIRAKGSEIYWLARRGMGRSTVSGARVERALGGPTTLRNITTVRKLAQQYGG